MKGLNELIVVLWILFGILLSPLFFSAFDFWAGIRKAKQRGERITSEGWKRTVDKIARYYNMLLALVVVDCMQIAGIWYLDTYYDYHLPTFPFITLLGTMVVAAIEVRSIFEKAEDKVKKQVSDVSVLIGALIKSSTDAEAVKKAVDAYMSGKEETNESRIKK